VRILQIVIFPLRGSGSGVYADQLSAGLIDAGHTVKVLCSDHSRPKKNYPTEAVLFSNGTNAAFDLDFNFPAFTTHPQSTRCTFGSLTDAQRRAYHQAFQDKIERELARFQPDIVHAHHGWVIGAILADLDVPYLISLHGTEHLGFQRYPDYQRTAIKGLCGAHRITALTEHDKRLAIDTYAIDPGKIDVVTTGIDTRVFRPMRVDIHSALRRYAIDGTNRPVVLYVGKLTAVKGVEVLLKAAELYGAIDEKPITLIAGDGDLKPSLESFAKVLGLENVHFIGIQDRQTLVALYNIADVVAFPSMTDFFPLVALEALACGTPVIASDVGGLRQIVDDQIGRLVPPGDSSAFAENIVTAIRSQLKTQAGETAVTRMRQNFSLENMVQHYVRIYESILAQQPV